MLGSSFVIQNPHESMRNPSTMHESHNYRMFESNSTNLSDLSQQSETKSDFVKYQYELFTFFIKFFFRNSFGGRIYAIEKRLRLFTIRTGRCEYCRYESSLLH